MGFKNFLIGVIKNLIILLVATLIFSTVTFDLPNLVKGVFGDIFSYASPEAQKQVVGKLADICSSLDRGQEAATLNQVCANKTLLDSMKKNCANYREFKKRNIKIENEEQTRETCQQIESGEVERACGELGKKDSLLPDLSSIGSLCKDYKSGKISDREFFFNVISGSIPSQMQTPNIGALEKYNQAMNYLNNNKIIYFVVLAVLMILLYLLVKDIRLFLLTLTAISFSIGILIMLPYIAILAYEKFIGIDTTPLLSSIFGGGIGIEPKAIISVILLLFLRTYTPTIIILGFVFLAIGSSGKIYKILTKEKTQPKKEMKLKKRKKQH